MLVDGIEFTDKEMAIVQDYELRSSQLRNFRKVLNTCTPKKEAHLTQHVLPGYLMREMNARNKAKKIMKKKGFVHRGAR